MMEISSYTGLAQYNINISHHRQALDYEQKLMNAGQNTKGGSCMSIGRVPLSTRRERRNRGSVGGLFSEKIESGNQRKMGVKIAGGSWPRGG